MEHPKNDFRDYSNNSLMHYGVLGMKWGVRRAREYANDVAWQNRNEAIRKSREALKQHRNKKQYKSEVKAHDVVLRETLAKNKSLYKQKSKSMKPVKGASAKDIFKNEKEAAYANAKSNGRLGRYRTRNYARKADRIVANVNTTSAALGGLAGLGMLGAGIATSNPALIGYGGSTLGRSALTAGAYQFARKPINKYYNHSM